MRMSGRNEGLAFAEKYLRSRCTLALTLFVFMLGIGKAQTAIPDNVPQQVQQLTDAVARAQSQLNESQRQLEELRRQLAVLQAKLAASQAATSAVPIEVQPASAQTSSSSPESTDAAVQDIRERQAMQEAQIATQEQTKVESDSKYPIKLTGLLLLNAFVNTGAVDMSSTPTMTFPGDGSTGLSIRQTILGFDARGPHLLGARSYADLRVDFAGTSQGAGSTNAYAGYYNSYASFLRLRTAHAGLQWQHTDASFSLDRPIFSPDSPTSLTAVAEPALAWSGNLWTWNPQIGVTRDMIFGDARALRLQAALIDVGDAPLSPSVSVATPTITPPSATEQSRWPGVEARIAFVGNATTDEGNHFGVGGYFAPHHTNLNRNFDSWAATTDARLLFPAHLQLTAFAYRGLGLGGLGGGAYKDFAYRPDTGTSRYYVRGLSDAGGWTELKEKLNERFEFNAAFGMDNVFAKELRLYATSGGPSYLNLARNRTYTGNIIYSPSAYLLFSFEYRHLSSSPIVGSTTGTNIFGLAAGYKF
jgi:hypothetical protein